MRVLRRRCFQKPSIFNKLFPRSTRRGVAVSLSAVLVALLLSAGPGTSPLWADHVEEEEAQLRGLNSAVLQLLSEKIGASPAQQAALEQRAAVVLAERMEALESLIEEHPEIAVSVAFSEDVLARLGAAFTSSASLLEERGAWSGVIQQLVINQESLDTQTTVTDLVVGSQSYRVHFTPDAAGDAKSGDQVVVTGVRAGGAIAGVDTETTGSAAPATSCSDTTGDQKIAFLMITFPDTPFPNDVTRPGLLDIGFSETPASVNTYLQENSYNAASASTAVGDVYPLDGSSYLLDPAPESNPYGCSTSAGDYNQIIDAALAKASADGFVPENYHRIAFVHPTPAGVSSCWYGLGSLGCWGTRPDNSASAGYSWLHTNAMDSRAEGVRVAAHELGHNKWLHHSGSLDYGAEPLGAPDPTAGGHSEYGDVYSVMGSSSGHFTPYQKVQLGWYTIDSGSYSVQTVAGNGTFYLHPGESSATGLKGLKIKRGTDTTNSNWLWLEYRDNSGDYDTTTTTSSNMSGGLIRYDDSRNDSGTHRHKTFLLDFHPETGTFSDPALAVGESWGDPHSNLTIEVLSVTGDNRLEVRVTFGAISCIPADPTVTLAPSSQSTDAGAPAAFTVSVQNNDNVGCWPESFSLSPAALPSGWSSSLAASIAGIALGATDSTTWTVTPSADAGGSSRGLSVTATQTTSGLSDVSNSATLNVLTPTVSLQVYKTGGRGSFELDNPSTTCGSDCTYDYPETPVETVTVTAVPGNKQCLLSWGGACAALDPATQTSCTVDVSADVDISAGFGKCGGGGSGGGGGGNGGGGGSDKPGNGKGRNK